MKSFMKNKFIYPVLLCLFSIPAFAQNESDALRFSQNYPGGTARSLSMGSAFGALGGDASSLSINPAGIGVYRKSEFTFTMGVNSLTSNSKYLGTSYDDYKTKFNLSNLAYVYTYNTNKNEGFVSASFGIGYNRLNDFNSNTIIIGQHANSSLLDQFAFSANNKIDGNLSSDQQRNILKNSTVDNDPAGVYFYEGLAYKANELLFYNSDNNKFMNDYMFDGYDVYQKKNINKKGGIGEYDFSFGTNFSHLLYLGATLGVQRLDYEEVSQHYEQAASTAQVLNSFRFAEHFNSYGNGVNFKIGAILKPVDLLRVGLAYHSPTFYKLTSEFYTSVDVDFKTTDPADIFLSTDILTNDYTLKTPSKLIGSLALVFDKYGLISMDVERVNYSSAHLSSDGYDYIDENSAIKNAYKENGIFNFRLGGEAKAGPLAIRAGYSKYATPYNSSQFNHSASNESISGGIGARGKSVYFDLAYVYTTTKEMHNLYYSGNDNLAQLKNTNSKIMATLGFRF